VTKAERSASASARATKMWARRRAEQAAAMATPATPLQVTIDPKTGPLNPSATRTRRKASPAPKAASAPTNGAHVAEVVGPPSEAFRAAYARALETTLALDAARVAHDRALVALRAAAVGGP